MMDMVLSLVLVIAGITLIIYTITRIFTKESTEWWVLPEVTCNRCGYSWVAVCPSWTLQLECDKCGEMVKLEVTIKEID